MSDWTPLQDTYNQYTRAIEESIEDGTFDDYDLAQEIIWPSLLNFGDDEKDDINSFLVERTNELMTFSRRKGLTPKIIANSIFKSLLAGMVWENERIGR